MTAQSTLPAGPFVAWVLALFGTAVGAGVLFLPNQAGQGGFWVLGVAALLVWPTITLGHRFYALIPSRADAGSDFSAAVAHWWPQLAGLLRLLFVVWLFVLLMAYSIALTNGLGHLLAQHPWVAVEALPRPWLAVIVLGTMMLLLGSARPVLVHLLGALSLMLIGLLVTVSFALVPHWRQDVALAALALPEPAVALQQLLVLYPLLTLSFMFFPSLSGLVLDLQARLPDRAGQERVTGRIIAAATLALLGFVLGFVASFMLAVPAADFVAANRENLSALDLVGEQFSHSWLGGLGPAVSLIALTSSFIGIYVGYRLALLAVFGRTAHQGGRHRPWAEALLLAGTFCLLLPPVVANVPVMDILGDLVAPLGAIFLLLVPAGIVLTAADFRPQRGPAAWFSVTAGVVVVGAYFVGKVLGGS
ncbi:MAG: aromatic amino acid transport family protein [Lamprobacter sp.]|uniref:aromatic amino acid transport family protein n=1 Tax=Lamprobacter sp. TaxID=3100796 RepID=UPI002B262030|nr:aromatic amino acid transport family protein [Lamprobacter sp.]MEA3642561.1 aromatic amino acid transport family protein [Lamprobacter sp.]